MMGMRRGLLTAILLGLAAWVPAQLTDEETRGLRDTLFLANLEPEDLQFERKPFDLPAMPLVLQGIDDPLQTTADLMTLHEESELESLADVLTAVMQATLQTRPTIPSLPASPVLPDEGLEAVPPEVLAPVLDLVAWVGYANDEVRLATAELTAEERRRLIEDLPRYAAGQPEIEFEFVRSPYSDEETVLSLLERVDLPRIHRAGYHLAAAVDRVARDLELLNADVPERVKVNIDGVLVVLAGKGDDLHEDTDAFLTIDLGGDDRYVGRHGAGVGYASVLVDVRGDDRYDLGDLNAGAAILGVGVARDLGGNDRMTGGALTFGSALAGVGVFAKSGGNDVYDSYALSQGFAQFGLGLLRDSNGNDKYSLGFFGQGAARTDGVGWLLDDQGDDVYRAGGEVLHAPLFEDVHFAFAQGFSIGYREEDGGQPGGVGLLTDHQGYDFYLAETYAQAASYWYSLGSLYDAEGNDAYTAHHYAQSSAMHITSAYLFDLAGDDFYSMKLGASHAIGHDYGVAVLLDREGDDGYASRDSQPGLGINNGLGLFIDSAGDDRYLGPPGVGRGARGASSLGVFADLTGQDLYAQGLSDGNAKIGGELGSAWDLPGGVDSETVASAGPDAVSVEPGTMPFPGDEAMAELYRKATQWGVGTAEAEVDQAMSDLIAIGETALEWMLDNRLAQADRFAFRAYGRLMRNLDPQVNARQLGRVLLAEPTVPEIKAGIRIAMEADVADIGLLLPRWVEDEELTSLVIRAAGELGASAMIPDLNRVLLRGEPMQRRAAIVSLRQIGDPGTIGTASALLTDSDLLVRRAALNLLKQFPEEAIRIGRNLVEDADLSLARMGVRLIAAQKEQESYERLGDLLMDPRPGIRLEAVLSLDGDVPLLYRDAVRQLQNDPVPEVRAAARGIDFD
jgi:hypothetical protein